MHEPQDQQQGYSVLILNYNHWRDTQACVESVLSSDVRPRQVVVCDNGSSDGSLAHLVQWVDHYGVRPLSRRLLTRTEAETGPAGEEHPAEDILLVDNGANLGYAGGNNVGLRLLLRSGAPFVWLLNNDTLVAPGAAQALLQYMRGHPRCGLCGALTRYLDDPEIVQCYGGGWYDTVWALGGLHGDGDRLPRGAAGPEHGPTELGYVNGASVFARRAFLLDVGLMDEAYFLYCEEWDWAERAKGRWTLGWAPEAEVLHREGLSTGVSNRRGLGRSARSAWRLARSRLLFTWKFRPWALPTALAGQFFALSKKVLPGSG